jgi:hypothetical protein
MAPVSSVTPSPFAPKLVLTLSQELNGPTNSSLCADDEELVPPEPDVVVVVVVVVVPPEELPPDVVPPLEEEVEETVVVGPEDSGVHPLPFHMYQPLYWVKAQMTPFASSSS